MRIDVEHAANILDVSAVRVRQLIAAGDLRASRFGRSWQIDLDSVHRYDDLRPSGGRPAKPRRAWDLIRNAAPASLDDVHRLAVQARRRADRKPARVAAGELPYLLDSPHIVQSGASSAAHHGAPVQPKPPHDLYVRASGLAQFVEDHSLRFGVDGPNLVMRVVPDDVWPFADDDRYAPAVVAAIDLVDERDDRSAREALAVL